MWWPLTALKQGGDAAPELLPQRTHRSSRVTAVLQVLRHEPHAAIGPRPAAEEPEEKDKRCSATVPTENCWGSVNKRRL